MKQLMKQFWAALGICGLALGSCPCHAQSAPAAQPDSITASFALVPGTRRTPGSIPLLLRLRNTTGKPLRVFKGFFTPDLFTAAVYFELDGPSLLPVYHPTPTGFETQTYPDFFSAMKVSFDASYRYTFIKIKPGKTFDIRFDLAQLTLDKRQIPPGTYTLGGLFGINQEYPPTVKRQEDIYAGGTTIPPITLVISKPATQ